MTKTAKVIVIISGIVLVLVFGILYFIYSFLRALAPCEVEVSDKRITSACGMVNGFSIEKLKVDSIGADNYPVVYTVQQIVSCSMNHPTNKPPIAPKKILFDKPGQYSWSEEHVNIPFTHFAGYRYTTDSSERAMRSFGTESFETCPLKMEEGQWYFIDTYDPRLVGVYLYIDKNGERKQFTIETGVSPI